MINNLPSSTPDNAPGQPDFQALVDQSIVEGVIGGLQGFLVHNRVNLRPTNACSNPLAAFISRLLSEYEQDPSDQYPFDESFKERLIVRTAEEAEVFKALYEGGEYENLVKVGHVVGGAAIAQFLEDHRERALKVIRNLRGE